MATHLRRFRWFVALVAGLGLATAAQAGKPLPGKIVIPPYPGSYEVLSAFWWQWDLSMPKSAHPLFETAEIGTGQRCSLVWFLGGTNFFDADNLTGHLVGKADRVGEVPFGTSLFFPIVNSGYTNCNADGTSSGETDAELRELAKFWSDFIVPESLYLEIDDRPIRNLKNLRAMSPPLPIGPVMADNIWDLPAGTTFRMVGDGYYVWLAPLPVGTHTIRFGGTTDYSSMDGAVIDQVISYTITVVPRHVRH